MLGYVFRFNYERIGHSQVSLQMKVDSSFTMHCTTKGFNLKHPLIMVKVRYLMILANLLLGVFLSTNAQSANQKIVILGDSISAAYGVPTEMGWVSLFEERLKQENKAYTVINASISGETTDGGLKRLSGIISRHQPAFILIELGGNDGLRGYPLNVIRSNLEALVKQTKAEQVTPILLAMRIPPNYGTRYASGFHSLYSDIAQANDITLVPFLLSDVATQPDMMQPDGIHPTALAQPVLLEAVWESIKPLL